MTLAFGSGLGQGSLRNEIAVAGSEASLEHLLDVVAVAWRDAQALDFRYHFLGQVLAGDPDAPVAIEPGPGWYLPSDGFAVQPDPLRLHYPHIPRRVEDLPEP